MGEPSKTRDNPRGFWAACGLILLLFFLVSKMKVSYSMSMRPYDAASETGYYWSESALQYRYARLVGRGQGIPEVDTDAEAPAGVRTADELTLLMERTTGLSYKLFSRIRSVPFHTFTLHFYSFFSSLALFAFFLAAWHLTRSPVLSVLATAAYGLGPASWARYIGSFVYEGFALPFLFLAVAGMLGCLRAAEDSEPGASKAWAWLAALSFAIGLGGWHFSRFFFLVAVAALAAHAFLTYRDARAQDALTVLLLPMAVGATCAGLFFTVLVETRFLTSPPLIILWTLLLGQYVRRRLVLSRLQWSLCSGFVAILAVALSVILSRGGGDSASFGHVYSLFAEKLIHLLRKPANPAELGVDARILWVDPFNSPTFGNVFYYFFPVAVPIIAMLAAAWLRPRGAEAGERKIAGLDFLVWAFFASWFGLYLLIARLAGIAFFFAALLAVHVLSRSGRRALAALGVCALLAGAETAKAIAGNTPFNVFLRIAERFTFSEKEALSEDSNIRQALEWISANTHEGQRFVAGLGMSPLVLAYADRPIVIQPKFESARSRSTFVEFLRSLYGSEEEAYRFCSNMRADYLVYQATWVVDDTSDGDRYTAGFLRLSPDSAAFLFHFRPEGLRRFRLVFQNADFRIFAVARGRGGRESTSFIPFAQSVYDLSEFRPDSSGWLGPGGSEHLKQKLLLRKRSLQAAEARRNLGDLSGAERQLSQVLSVFPDDSPTWQELGRIRFKRGDTTGAEDALRHAVRTNPNHLAAHELLADVLLARADFAGARTVLERARELSPRNSGVLNNLGAALARTGALTKSLEVFRTAQELSPSDPEIARNVQLIKEAIRSHRGAAP